MAMLRAIFYETDNTDKINLLPLYTEINNHNCKFRSVKSISNLINKVCPGYNFINISRKIHCNINRVDFGYKIVINPSKSREDRSVQLILIVDDTSEYTYVYSIQRTIAPIERNIRNGKIQVVLNIGELDIKQILSEKDESANE